MKVVMFLVQMFGNLLSFRESFFVSDSQASVFFPSAKFFRFYCQGKLLLCREENSYKLNNMLNSNSKRIPIVFRLEWNISEYFISFFFTLNYNKSESRFKMSYTWVTLRNVGIEILLNGFIYVPIVLTLENFYCFAFHRRRTKYEANLLPNF